MTVAAPVLQPVKTPTQSVPGSVYQDVNALLINLSKRETSVSTCINAVSVKRFQPSRCIKASFYIPENTPDFPTTRGFRMQISITNTMVIFFIFFTHFQSSSSTTSGELRQWMKMTMVNSGLKGLNIAVIQCGDIYILFYIGLSN